MFPKAKLMFQTKLPFFIRNYDFLAQKTFGLYVELTLFSLKNVDFDQKIDFPIGSIHFGAGYLYVFLIQVF